MVDSSDDNGSVASNAEAEAFTSGTSLELDQTRRSPVTFGRKNRHRAERSEQIVDAVLPKVRMRQAQLKLRRCCRHN